MPTADRRHVHEIVLVAVLLASHWLMATTSAVHKSLTFDEVAHIAAGYLYWTAGDYRFNPESGNLTQRWAALPLLALDVAVPPPEHPARRQGNVWTVGGDVLFRLGNDAETMIFAARSMIALLSVALGALVYLGSRRLFGRLAATVSLVLYTFSPTMLAHGRMATADLAAAFFFLLSTFTLARLLEGVTGPRLAAAGLAVAGLVLAKMSWMLVMPTAALLAVWRVWIRRRTWRLELGARTFEADAPGRRLAVAAVAGLAVTVIVVASVWTLYGLRYRAAGAADAGGGFVHSWESRLEQAGAAAPAIRLAREHRLLPEAFLWGLAYTLATTQERDAFLNGKYSSTGWWYFFPYAFLVKTPPALLALLALAAASRLRLKKRIETPLAMALLVFSGVYLATAISSSLNLGHRHLLPLYPVLFIAVGGVARWIGPTKPGRAMGGAVVVLLGLFVTESWLVRPHYLSYFNAFAGGPENGYRHLVDSSLDWGQDLPALADRLREHRPDPVWVAYFGSASPEYYGVRARWLHSYFPAEVPRPPLPLTGGTYCVSATLLQSLHTGRPGPWTPEYESEYQELRREMERFWEEYREPASRRALLERRTPAEWDRLFFDFNRSRSVRLFRALRERRPEARAGYSILIFRLSDDEVRQAL